MCVYTPQNEGDIAMVNLLTGPKGDGKTQEMINLANNVEKSCNGNTLFIKKSRRDTNSLSFKIRAICMEDYESIGNIDEYVGFLYGIVSSDHDIEVIFIDGILKHANISLENIPTFIERLKKISKTHNIEFYVGVSAEKEKLHNIDLTDCNILA